MIMKEAAEASGTPTDLNERALLDAHWVNYFDIIGKTTIAVCSSQSTRGVGVCRSRSSCRCYDRGPGPATVAWGRLLGGIVLDLEAPAFLFIITGDSDSIQPGTQLAASRLPRLSPSP